MSFDDPTCSSGDENTLKIRTGLGCCCDRDESGILQEKVVSYVVLRSF